MKYKLFLSDFDGTLVRADGTISERTKAAIARYRDKGGIFAVVTGRMPSAILPRVRELGLTGPVAAYQGAAVLLPDTGELLSDGAFEACDALAALRFLEAENHHVHAYTAETMYANRRDGMLEAYEKICRVTAQIVEGESLFEFIKRTGKRVVKVLAMVEPQERFALQKRAQEALGERFYVTCSSEWLVEIMPVGQDKGSAVDFLTRYYAVSPQETAAIGDQLNDLPMLLRAGGKFAPANAEEEVRQIAQVVSSNEEDGVAEALEYAMGERE